MDLATVIGVSISFVFLAFGILSGGGLLSSYLDVASIFIVLGGAFGSVIASHSADDIKKFITILLIAFKKNAQDPSRIILTLLSFSEKARREGLLALEDDLDETSDLFLKSGIQLVVDGTEPEVVKNIMDGELDALSTRHEGFIGIFNNLGKMCPAFGMIGTLIGLIVMMSNLGGDASAIGRGMAAALLTTLYGSILANVFFIPISKKLEKVNNDEIVIKTIMIEGTLSIQSGDNPRILQQKLVSYFPSSVREDIKNQIGD